MLKFFLLLISVTVIMSCGSDDDCIVADWIGVYDLDPNSEDCSDPDLSLNSSITISTGTSTNTIDFDGVEVEVNGCNLTFTDPFFGISGEAQLEGNEITTSVLGCSGKFIRR